MHRPVAKTPQQWKSRQVPQARPNQEGSKNQKGPAQPQVSRELKDPKDQTGLKHQKRPVHPQASRELKRLKERKS